MGVKLLVLHPQILAQPCSECRQWVYDDRHRKLLRGGQPVARPPGVPTPCSSCPKQNAIAGAYFDRHVHDFAWLLRRRHEISGTAGACLTAAERADPLLHRNLGVVDALLRQIEREQLVRQIVQSLTRSGVLA
jgi:hypothetical protein